jgi:pimeloyl-ACP methyl ester carboxylesterase
MADFILVHGGLHGAWCWELLQTELRRLGHKSFAMDMPIDQPNVWIDGYVDAVLSAVAGKAADDAYLVGHSMGGLIVPRVAAERPRGRIIFLCAGFAHTSEAERLENLGATDMEAFSSRLEADAQGRVTMSRDNAISGFYHDVPPELADWAAGKLRPQWVEGYAKVDPIAPYADRVAGIIACADDRIVLPEPHRKLAEARFGITPAMLPGSHSPFLSRPAELAGMMDEIVRADRS